MKNKLEDTVRCENCGLVQFKRKLCRKCKTTILAFLDITDALGTLLYFIRVSKGMSMVDVRALSGVARIAIAHTETKETVLHVNTLKRLAKAYEVDVAKIFRMAEYLLNGE